MGACPLSVPRTFAIRRTKASTGLDFVRADNEQERGQETELFPISDTPGGSVESSSEVTDRDHRLHHRCYFYRLASARRNRSGVPVLEGVGFRSDQRNQVPHSEVWVIHVESPGRCWG